MGIDFESHLVLGFALDNEHVSLLYNKRKKICEFIEKSIYNILPSILINVIKEITVSYLFKSKKKRRNKVITSDSEYINYEKFEELEDDLVPLHDYYQIQVFLSCPWYDCEFADRTVYFNFLDENEEYEFDEIKIIISGIEKRELYLNELWTFLELDKPKILLFSLPYIH